LSQDKHRRHARHPQPAGWRPWRPKGHPRRFKALQRLVKHRDRLRDVTGTRPDQLRKIALCFDQAWLNRQTITPRRFGALWRALRKQLRA